MWHSVCYNVKTSNNISNKLDISLIGIYHQYSGSSASAPGPTLSYTEMIYDGHKNTNSNNKRSYPSVPTF